MTALTTTAATPHHSASIGRAARALLADRRRSALHLATFVIVAAALFATGSVDVASGSAAFWTLLAWGAVAALDQLITLALAVVAGTVDGHPPVPAGGGVVMTGSIASTVKLDYDRGTAEKSYEPTRFVRALYRLSFQAPFPYAGNAAALEARGTVARWPDCSRSSGSARTWSRGRWTCAARTTAATPSSRS